MLGPWYSVLIHMCGRGMRKGEGGETEQKISVEAITGGERLWLSFETLQNSTRFVFQIRLLDFRDFLMLRINKKNERIISVLWQKYRIMYTGCPRRNVPDFGRVFLTLKYTDITQNTYVQSWTVTEIMAREKCGLLAGPWTVPVSWQVLSMFVLECGVRFSSH